MHSDQDERDTPRADRRSPYHHDREDSRQEREKNYVKQVDQHQQYSGHRQRQQH